MRYNGSEVVGDEVVVVVVKNRGGSGGGEEKSGGCCEVDMVAVKKVMVEMKFSWYLFFNQ